MTNVSYDLWYWTGLQGRGEFVRLAFEATGTAYKDVGNLPASEGGGPGAVMSLIRAGDAALRA